MRFLVLLTVLLGVATASAATTAVNKAQEKDIISDIMGLFDWAMGLLETFGFDIMDILGQFLPAELMDILQLLQDIGIIPAAKKDIIGDLWAAIEMIMQLGEEAFQQLMDLLPPEILAILEMLFELGAFPGKALVRQSFDEWLMALMDVLFQLLGDNALDMLLQIAADFGIPAEFIQILWDMLMEGFPAKNAKHAVRVDIIDWAIQMLIDLGLSALAQLAEFIPPEILSILIDLVLGLGFPKA
jgi:hypothetical protein